MPDLNIHASHKTIAGLEVLVQRTNNAQNTNLSLLEWLELHCKELVIAEEISIAIKVIQEQQQHEAEEVLQAAVRVRRNELLANLEEKK